MSRDSIGGTEGAVSLASPRRVGRKRVWRWLRMTPSGAIGITLLLLFAASAAFAPLLTPHDPTKQNTRVRLLPPNSDVDGVHYLLGTDQLGRDLLSRMLHGARISVVIGLASVGLAGVFGLILGLLAGYFRGTWESVVMISIEVLLAMPFVLVAIVAAAVWGPGLWNVIFILAGTGWVAFARVIHGATLAASQQEFVSAAKAVGASRTRILGRHILPQVFSSFIVLATLQVGRMLVAESGLSFLGLGVEPGLPTWGSIMSDGREYIYRAPWLMIFPGIAVTLTVLAMNLTSTWLKQVLDPLVRE